MSFFHGRHLGDFLLREGLVPANARDVQLHIAADSAVYIRYEVLVTDASLDQLQRALAAFLAEHGREVT